MFRKLNILYILFLTFMHTSHYLSNRFAIYEKRDESNRRTLDMKPISKLLKTGEQSFKV